MDRVARLVSELSLIYQEISETFSSFQKSNGLDCLAGCGACCKSQEVEATVLEMLPMAYEMYLQNDFSALEEENWTKLSCNQYKITSPDGNLGYCSRYSTRPGICIMFGAALYRGKNGEAKLSLCKRIKEINPLTIEDISMDSKYLMSTWRQMINAVDPSLSAKLFPINLALRYALEYVSNYYWFNPPELLADLHGSPTTHRAC